jgi:hypothetical protein
MNAIDRLVGLLTKLPGIGKKTAGRLAYFILDADPSYAGSWRRNCRACTIISGAVPYVAVLPNRTPAQSARIPEETRVYSVWWNGPRMCG